MNTTTNEFYIDCDGIALHAKLDKPEGVQRCPLCILIHGFTGHMEERHIIAAQETMNEIGIAVLRVEMYGHGMSGGRFEDHTLYKWVTNALTVVDYARKLDFVTDLYLSGHSQGGLLTMLVAGMKANCFKAILPLSPAWMIPEQARTGQLLGTEFDPENIPDMVERHEHSLNGNYVRVAQMIHVEDAIARYHGPVLVVQGDADDAVPPSYAVKACELYENATLAMIEGDTHCYDEHLDQVLDAIRAFLQNLQTA